MTDEDKGRAHLARELAEARRRIAELEGAGEWRASKQAYESRGMLVALVQSSSDAIIGTTVDGVITHWNLAARKIYGYTAREAVGQPVSLVLPHDCVTDVAEILERTRHGERVAHFEALAMGKAEKRMYVSVTISPIKDAEGNVVGISVIARDVTYRKLVEEQLIAHQQKVRVMASQLVLAEEQERRRIAADLHDRIGQNLAISRIKLDALLSTNPSSDLAGSLNDVGRLIEQAIQDTRSLTFELSPRILYELGFWAAVEWLAEQIQERHGLRVGLQDDGQPRPMDENVRILLFRAVRELLINVVKHARAGNVVISVRREYDRIRIEVGDDGIGCDISRLGSLDEIGGGFGLLNVQERLEYLGGDMQIASEPGQGTRVILNAPLSSSSASRYGVPA